MKYLVITLPGMVVWYELKSQWNFIFYLVPMYLTKTIFHVYLIIIVMYSLQALIGKAVQIVCLMPYSGNAELGKGFPQYQFTWCPLKWGDICKIHRHNRCHFLTLLSRFPFYGCKELLEPCHLSPSTTWIPLMLWTFT